MFRKKAGRRSSHGNYRKWRIRPGLSESEIQRIVEDSEKYAEQDKERKAVIETANRADSVVNDTEKALNEYADKLDKSEADQIREKITSLRELVAKAQSGEITATAAEIKEKTDELQVASLNLFDKMHKPEHGGH
ncbi:uncharacterized protein B0T15DRAFT_489658 [Chaetomium strumarium]|uniref:Uncharacterized protein n=1 Tax=Chaetomium strumarium TaxID=1170767 RepID=A0AAJ0M6M0_9PEZI|nr:hypothetical protein B0T15DRAFT_489658 [Chaetomium strumarium]